MVEETTEAALAGPLPEQSRAVYAALRLGGLAILKTAFRLRVLGVEHVPREGGVVLASLHRSNWDTFAIGVPPRWRRLRPMAKIELYRFKPLGWVIGKGGAFPVERGKGDQQAVATAVALLRAGELIAMYPEGTRNRQGRARLHTGAARLALEAGAALVPVAVAGTDEVRLWPPRLPQFRVAYGPPIALDDLRGHEDSRRAAAEATERWRVAVEALRASIA